MSRQRDNEMDEPVSDRSQEVGHRRYVRYPVTMPVIGRAAQFDAAELPGTVQNIGGGGLMAEFPVLIFPGSFLDLILQSPQGPFAVTGQVAWTGPAGPQVAHGIAFYQPPGDDFAKELA